MNNQVVVIGGGVMGSALACWPTGLEPSVRVTVVERDPSYEYASSALSAASIRQQFSTPVNIRISQASIAFLRNAADELGFDDERPDIMLREHGYLYLAGVAGAAQLRQAHTVHKACGSDVALLDRLDLGKRFGGFYVLVLLMAGTGLATAILAGLNKIVFQGSGDLPSSFYPTFLAHALLATILANLIVLHVLAALYHQFVRKDSLFRRMFFRRRAS